MFFSILDLQGIDLTLFCSPSRTNLTLLKFIPKEDVEQQREIGDLLKFEEKRKKIQNVFFIRVHHLVCCIPCCVCCCSDSELPINHSFYEEQ